MFRMLDVNYPNDTSVIMSLTKSKSKIKLIS